MGIEVLRRLEKAQVLDNVILIGSGCIPFYKEYFSEVVYTPSIRTRDIDFPVPEPSKIKVKVDLPNLLKDLGFIVGFSGRGVDKPHPLTQLGLNAQALRFLDFLSERLIQIAKGREAGIKILRVLIDNGGAEVIKKIFDLRPKKWPGKVTKYTPKLAQDKDSTK